MRTDGAGQFGRTCRMVRPYRTLCASVVPCAPSVRGVELGSSPSPAARARMSSSTREARAGSLAPPFGGGMPPPAPLAPRVRWRAPHLAPLAPFLPAGLGRLLHPRRLPAHEAPLHGCPDGGAYTLPGGVHTSCTVSAGKCASFYALISRSYDEDAQNHSFRGGGA